MYMYYTYIHRSVAKNSLIILCNHHWLLLVDKQWTTGHNLPSWGRLSIQDTELRLIPAS